MHGGSSCCNRADDHDKEDAFVSAQYQSVYERRDAHGNQDGKQRDDHAYELSQLALRELPDRQYGERGETGSKLFKKESVMEKRGTILNPTAKEVVKVVVVKFVGDNARIHAIAFANNLLRNKDAMFVSVEMFNKCAQENWI